MYHTHEMLYFIILLYPGGSVTQLQPGGVLRSVVPGSLKSVISFAIEKYHANLYYLLGKPINSKVDRYIDRYIDR